MQWGPRATWRQIQKTDPGHQSHLSWLWQSDFYCVLGIFNFITLKMIQSSRVYLLGQACLSHCNFDVHYSRKGRRQCCLCLLGQDQLEQQCHRGEDSGWRWCWWRVRKSGQSCGSSPHSGTWSPEQAVESLPFLWDEMTKTCMYILGNQSTGTAWVWW